MKKTDTPRQVNLFEKTNENNDNDKKTSHNEYKIIFGEILNASEFLVSEGMPKGDMDEILRLSSPPFYTLSPNPWLPEFLSKWEDEKPSQNTKQSYHRSPFVADVSEGKNDPIYNAHSYHTKVPHKAIMRYILHYTNPGDIVFDGFCGTGMTGVAAQMCGNRQEVQSLGYRVDREGVIYKEELDTKSTGSEWVPFSKLGIRKAVLNDLSPAATFIAHNYNCTLDIHELQQQAYAILDEVESELSWMYTTKHKETNEKCKINFVIWSDIYICNSCLNEVVFWEAALDEKSKKVLEKFKCTHCSAELTKKSIEKSFSSKFDKLLKKEIKQVKQKPVEINYTYNGKRLSKSPDKEDLELLEKIENFTFPNGIAIDRMPIGKETRRNDPVGLTHVHHFFYSRALIFLAHFIERAKKTNPKILWVATAIMEGSSKLNRERPYGLPSKLSGTLYVSSMIREVNPIDFVRRKIKKFQNRGVNNSVIISTSSSTELNIPDNTLDYIFIDPPFGGNLYYSELNFIWEAWLKVTTNNKNEAIENSAQGKSLFDYKKLMEDCFKEAYRILKPGHWMTVEFSNTKASVWNAIATALSSVGFIVANVSGLDKKQGSFKAVTTTTAVKQDLIITAYKPDSDFEKRFNDEKSTELGLWNFIRAHLDFLPVTKTSGNSLAHIPERDPRILFDQVVAYYVRKGYQLPVSSQEFQLGLAQRFKERDGMYFLDEQAAEYDKKKALVGELVQTSLFVSDEASAIQWLRQLLKLKPQVFSDINPQFMQQLSKNEVQLDLRDLLSQNFLCYDGEDDVPEQIHSYLSTNWKEYRNLPKDSALLQAKAKDRWYVPDPNKAGDLEKLRERSLLKEFEEYKSAKKKLKVFRIEAVRVGFKKLWEAQEFTSILDISSKLPNDVIAGDPVLLMYYDQAMMLSQANSGEDW